MKDRDLANVIEELTGGHAHHTDWREYYHAIRARLWIVALCAVIGAIGAAIFMARQEVRFRARAVLFIEQEHDRVLENVRGVREEVIMSVDMINTVVDLLSSYPFAQRVAERLKLHQDLRFHAAIPDSAGRQITVQDAAATLTGLVSAQYRKNTRLIDVFVTHPDPDVATTLANACADEYMRFVFERRTDANKAAQQFLVEEADRLRKKMRVSEEAMQSFRERERAASLDNLQQDAQTKVTTLASRLSELDQKIFQLDTDLKVARANVGNSEELLRLPSVAAEQKVARLTEAIAEQDRDILLLSQRYRAKHPAFIAARTHRESLIADRDGVLRNVISLLETQREHLQSQFDEVSKDRDEQEARLVAISGKSVEYNDLKRELETDTAMHQSVLSRMKQIDLTKGLTDSPVRIHERPSGAGRVGVSPFKVYSIGLFAGVLVAVAISFLLHLLDHTVQTVEQAEQVTELPVLAAVPRKKKVNALGGKERALNVITDRHGTIAESFRSLRASVAMLADADTRRSFLFTSPVPSEGKTFCSSNFAATLSQQGLKTLLIDADLRKPTVSLVFFGEHRKPGLSEVLSGQISAEEATFATEIENLSVITAGGRAPNPAELIASNRTRELIEQALKTYDRVVIDTAPVLAVSDTLLIAPFVNVTCLVIRAGSTPRKTAARAVRALTDIKCRPAGVVINFLPTGSGSHYYYSGRYYGAYSSRGVYGAKT